tara:strand:+ start:4703 stop:7057 length:2355 start_codon:yes stop_codon:yes gene_type:complete
MSINKMNTRYPTFAWWQGVVEDRNDPEKFGRYKVRILGYHTLDKSVLPTESLPWAIPMQPVTSAAISGVGSSPTGLVEGSAVIGFFVDGDDGQIPVIMGSFGVEDNVPTVLREGEASPESPESLARRGFYDPNGKFPRRKQLKVQENITDNVLKDKVKGFVSDGLGGLVNESGDKLTGKEEGVEEVDVGKNVLEEASSSRLSRGTESSEAHYSLKAKRDSRTVKIPRGFASKITGWNNREIPFEHDERKSLTDAIEGIGNFITNSTDEKDDGKILVKPGLYEPTYWEEPHPQGSENSKSQYPYNHVRETESGHVFEVDDTPGAERIHEYHTAGSFKEIQPDGTKVEKIVGDDYVIDLKNRLMYVNGNFDLMVEGDYNLNVKGNKYEHISGHSYNTVKGNRLNKIQGHELVDTQSSYLLMTAGNFNCQVGQSDGDSKKIGNYRLRVLGEHNTTVQGKQKVMNRQDYKHTVSGDFTVNTSIRTTLDPTAAVEAASQGSVPTPDALITGGSIKLQAVKNIQVTAKADGTPKVPGSPFGSSVNIVGDRINTTARIDMVERIGGLPGPVPNPVDFPPILQTADSYGKKYAFHIGTTAGMSRVVLSAPTGPILDGLVPTFSVPTIENKVIGAGTIVDMVDGAGQIDQLITGIGNINQGVGGAGTINQNISSPSILAMVGGANPLPSIGPIVDGTSHRQMSPASILDRTIGFYTNTVAGITTFASTGNVLIGAPVVAITAPATTMSGTLTVTGIVTGTGVTLQGHTHVYAPGTGGASSPQPATTSTSTGVG